MKTSLLRICKPVTLLSLLIMLSACRGKADPPGVAPLMQVPVKTFILDADTGNEMDDLYAIVRCLLDDEVQLIGLTSAHFNNVQLLTDSMWHIYPTEDINTVQISQDINEAILQSLNIADLPDPIGCDRMVGYAWGYYEGAPIPESPAVEFIAAQARKHDSVNKLNVLTLGAVTNVASVVLLYPELAKNIKLYALTMKMTEDGAWNKNSFNARNDINGLDILLSNSDLEMCVIPGNVSRTNTFKRNETQERLSAFDHPLAEMLSRRWDEVSAGDSWIMWDLALVESALHPEMATFELLSVPPENGNRKIQVITDIDEDKMRANYWEVMEALK